MQRQRLREAPARTERETFGQWVLRNRLRLGMSQGEVRAWLADRGYVTSQPSISDWETKNVEPRSWRMVAALAALFGEEPPEVMRRYLASLQSHAA